MRIRVLNIVEGNRVFAVIDDEHLGDVRVHTKDGRQVQEGEELKVSFDTDPSINRPTIAYYWAKATEI